MSEIKIRYDYSRLLGKIKELYGTQEKFSEKLGMGRVSLSQRLNGRLEFSAVEMTKTVKLLKMDYLDIPELFFVVTAIDEKEEKRSSYE